MIAVCNTKVHILDYNDKLNAKAESKQGSFAASPIQRWVSFKNYTEP